MLDLIRLWRATLENNATEQQHVQEYSEGTAPKAKEFDRATKQSSFEFQTPPKVLFVKDRTTLEPADLYSDLPEIALTEEENKARLKVVEEQTAKNPHFYDGNQMLVTGVVYDDSSNTLYMEARKVPYSFIVSLNNKKFPESGSLYQKPLFQTGVLAPLIARDGKSILLQRTAFGLYSVPAGFLEARAKETRLSFSHRRNLVTKTAKNELREEFVGIEGTHKLRFECSKAFISALSFRKTESIPMGTIEFIAPSYAACHSSELQHVALTNSAKDAHEHTSRHELIPLESSDRAALLQALLTGPLRHAGSSLYLPVLLSLTRLENQGSRMIALPRTVPNSNSVAWPLSIFSNKATKSLSERAQEQDDDKELTMGFNLIS